MNRVIDWIVRLAFVALACLVFYFAAGESRERRRADAAEHRLEVILARARVNRDRETLESINRKLMELESARLEARP